MTGTKTAAILVIGDEILSGRTLDTNTQTIARMLGEKGVALIEARTVPDIVDVIVEAVHALRARADYVFTTGGIGPTHDDRTAEAMARAFGVALERNAEAWARLAVYYGGEDNINAGRARMAMIPAGAALIDNPVSTAPGFRLGNVHVLAGVPKIMQGMLEGILPGLEGGAVIISRSVEAALAESVLSEGLAAVEAAHTGVSIGSYPKFTHGGPPAVVIVARGIDGGAVDSAIESVGKLMIEKGANPAFL